MMVITWENWNSEWEIPTRFTYGHSARLSIVSADRMTAIMPGAILGGQVNLITSCAKLYMLEGLSVRSP